MLIAIAGIVLSSIVITTFLLKQYLTSVSKSQVKRDQLSVTQRKFPFADLHRTQGLALHISFVIALIAVITAFEWKTPDDKTVIDFWDKNHDFEEFLDIPRTEIPPKPKPVLKTPVVIEVKDEIIPDDIEIIFDPEDIITEGELGDYEMPEDEDVVEFKIPEMKPIRNPSVWPKFVEYDSSFARYIYKHLEFPESVRRMGIEGIVYVEFTIDRKGKVKDIVIAKGVTKALDEAALKVIRNSPNWAPGRQGNNEVPVRVILPIEFALGN